MTRAYFKTLERHDNDVPIELDKIIEELSFNEQGLIPVITQDVNSKEILMFAWMNKESLGMTLRTKRMTYWSRSRNQLWIKGETSGHTQSLMHIAFDCDGDAILCQVDQSGGACHTGRDSCFYLHVDTDNKQVWVKGEHA